LPAKTVKHPHLNPLPSVERVMKYQNIFHGNGENVSDPLDSEIINLPVLKSGPCHKIEADKGFKQGGFKWYKLYHALIDNISYMAHPGF
jgi:hypothetical protein